jgi:signal transduction histidine kinase
MCFSRSNAQEKNIRNTYVDSAVYYFHKSQNGNEIDTVVFLQGLKMIDSVDLNDEGIKQIEKVAEDFKRKRKYGYYDNIELSIFERYVIAREYYKAINFAKEIIRRYDAVQNPGDRIIFLTLLAELRVPFRISDKLTEGFNYYTEKLRLYLQRNDSTAVSICYFVHGGFYRTIGLNDLSIYYYKKSIVFINPGTADAVGYVGKNGLVNNTAVLGQLYISTGNYHESILYSRTAYNSIIHNSGDSSNYDYTLCNIAYAKIMLNETDSVLDLLNHSIAYSSRRNSHLLVTLAYQIKGFYFLTVNQLDSAEYYLQECNAEINRYRLSANSTVGTLIPNYYLARVRMKQNRLKDATELIKSEIPKLVNLRGDVLMEYKLLLEIYLESGDDKNANETFRRYNALSEKLQADERKSRSMSFETEQKITSAEGTIANLKNEKHVASITRNYVIGIAGLLSVIILVVYNRNRLIKKTNATLSKTLKELNETQVQLVKSEKMAAFGKMASRVSHEIQNPLNFVNNFSDMSGELVEELVNSQNEEEKKQNAILLRANLQKINEHGKRVEIIVRQLQEHTRAGTAHEYFEG